MEHFPFACRPLVTYPRLIDRDRAAPCQNLTFRQRTVKKNKPATVLIDDVNLRRKHVLSDVRSSQKERFQNRLPALTNKNHPAATVVFRFV